MVNSNLKPTVNHLQDVILFNSFSPAELAILITKGTGVHYEPHSNVVIEGELSWGLYIILEGLLGVYKTNKMTAQSFDVGQLRASNFFGEMSLIDDNPRSATVKALTDCELFYISKDNFLEFLDQIPNLKLNFYTKCVQTLVNRLRELDDNYVISQYQLWQTALTKEGKSK